MTIARSIGDCPETPKALQMQGFEDDCQPLKTVETPLPEGGLEPPLRIT